MILNYYYTLFILSIILLLVLSARWQIRVDVNLAVFFILVPIDVFGYIKLSTAECEETAILANQLVYLGGCFLQLFVFLIVCELCHIKMNSGVRLSLFGISMLIYFSTFTVGYNGLFYKSVTLTKHEGITVLVKEYGPLHKYFYIMIILYMLATLGVLIYSFIKRKDISTKNIILLSILMAIGLFAFFGGRAFTRNIEFSPAIYILVEIVFLIISKRTRLYTITGDISDTVLQNGADGLICFDLKRNLLVYNSTALKMIPALSDARADYPLDIRVEEFKSIYDKLDLFILKNESSEEIIRSGESFLKSDIEYIKDGKRNSGYYIILRDVTAEHLYLESIQKYNEQMKAATDAAVAADNAKSTFLAQMSHEIRTPINAVLGMNEMILRECKDDTILNYASSIDSSGHALLFLINSILDFSKIESGRMEIVNAEYHTASFIYNLVDSSIHKADEKGLKFMVNVDETLPTQLIGDEIRLSQVVINLLSNAVKYTSEGSIRLTIKKSDVTTESDDNIMLHVEVEDTGIGIRPEDSERMFKSFERLDTDKNHSIEGTGLGMTIISKLLELMGSSIKYESEYGKGSRFWFDIRQGIANKTPMGDYNKQASLQMLRSKKNITFSAPDARILVVDDNLLNLKVTRSFLKVVGITPEESTTGEGAIELMRKNRYDIVFLDHMMPGMDGVETLNALKEQDLIPKTTKMIVFTANAIEGSKENYLSLGFDDYVSKPVSLEAMVGILEKYLKTDK